MISPVRKQSDADPQRQQQRYANRRSTATRIGSTNPSSVRSPSGGSFGRWGRRRTRTAFRNPRIARDQHQHAEHDQQDRNEQPPAQAIGIVHPDGGTDRDQHRSEDDRTLGDSVRDQDEYSRGYQRQRGDRFDVRKPPRYQTTPITPTTISVMEGQRCACELAKAREMWKAAQLA